MEIVARLFRIVNSVLGLWLRVVVWPFRCVVRVSFCRLDAKMLECLHLYKGDKLRLVDTDGRGLAFVGMRG